MTKQTFSADVEEFVAKSKQRMLTVVQFSIDDLVHEVQTPVAKGGRMRVDTGFLRASGRASLEGFPSGNGVKPADAPVGQYTGIYDDFDGAVVNAVLQNMELGDTFFWGWIANYAETREIYDGFLAAGLQNWQSYVTANSERFRGK